MNRRELEQLLFDLYQNKILETVWNAENQQNRLHGWILKNKTLSPWFLNLRKIGGYPSVFQDVVTATTDVIVPYSDELDLLIGVEMAGVTLVGAIGMELINRGYEIAIGYTRPLKEKVRKPAELLELMKAWGGQQYGQKDLVEAIMRSGFKVGVVDDMATDLGSKEIARLMILYEAERRKLVGLSCQELFYFLDRGADNITAGLKYAKETNPMLKPAQLNVHYAILFNAYLPKLADVMTTNEYAAIVEHQRNPTRFGTDLEWQSEVLKQAKLEAK